MTLEFVFFGIPTSRKLKATEIKNSVKTCYGFTAPKGTTIKVGDVVTASNYPSPIQVIELTPSGLRYKELRDVAINGVKIELGNATRPINKVALTEPVKATKEKKMTTSNKMVSGLMDRYKSQFFPEKEENIKVSMDGAMCVQVNGEYIGVKSDGTLTSYPEEFLIDFPVFSISKPQSQVKVGDVIRNGKSYGRVTAKNEDGSLRVLYFSGVSGDTQEIKDMLLGQSMVRVLVNMFNFNESNGLNPMMFLAMSDKQDFDLKTLLLMQMMGNGQSFVTNDANGFNPMMLLMLGDKEDSKSDMLSTMLMMQMMGGKSPFSVTSNPTA